jgi:signal transduction histidine kinase
MKVYLPFSYVIFVPYSYDLAAVAVRGRTKQPAASHKLGIHILYLTHVQTPFSGDTVLNDFSTTQTQPLQNPVRQSPSDDFVKREMFQRTFVLAAAAHEIKTPLAVIAGYADFLLGDHTGPLSEVQKCVLLEIQQNALRLQRVVQNFLNFSVLESGKFELNAEVGNLNQSIAAVVTHFARFYSERGTTLEFLPDGTLPEVSFDCVKVQHIVSNLLENALKFTPKGGQVKVTTRLYPWERRAFRSTLGLSVERRTRETNHPVTCVRIDVSDNGPGIPPEYHQDIFQEFLKLQQDGQSPGMGLGLAIARRLAEAHNGKIWVESKLGEGSTFSVLLPGLQRETNEHTL